MKHRGSNEVIAKKLVCCKEGFRHEKWPNLPNRKHEEKPTTRVGCRAFMRIKWHDQFKYWKVYKFHGEHNHDMVQATHVAYMRYVVHRLLNCYI